MRITPINQQMNTNRMNQNASANRSQNPSFGTRFNPDALAHTISWLKASTPEFVERHGRGLSAKIEKLKNDGNPNDYISFDRGAHDRVFYYGHECAGDSNTWTPCNPAYQAVYTPRLNVHHPKYLSSLSTDIGFKIDCPKHVGNDSVGVNSAALGDFLDKLTPKAIARHKAKITARIAEADAQKAARLEAAQKTAKNATGEADKKQTKSSIIAELEEALRNTKW